MSNNKEQRNICVIEHGQGWADGIMETFHEEDGIKENKIDLFKVHQGDQLPEITNYDLLVLSGGEMGVHELDKPEYEHIKKEYQLIETALKELVPILGICFGHQLLSHFFGGKVIRDEERNEIGWSDVKITQEGKKSPVFRGISDLITVFQYHNDHVGVAPNSAKLLATSPRSPFQALSYEDDHVLSFQFHPEIGETVGNRIYMRDENYLKTLGILSEVLTLDSNKISEEFRRQIVRQAVSSLLLVR